MVHFIFWARTKKIKIFKHLNDQILTNGYLETLIS